MVYFLSIIVIATAIALIEGFVSSGVSHPLARNKWISRDVKPRVTQYFANPTKTAEPTTKEYSFVNDELRSYAMKLHTRDQAPKEGQQKAETPFTQWQPQRSDYLQFLVDSLEVFVAFEDIVNDIPALSPLKSTGLERTKQLREDISWMTKYDSSLSVPACGENGKRYAAVLKSLAAESVPKFICHYYNHYFAHTAGGRMIGKKMCDMLLEGNMLKFYQWDGDVKASSHCSPA
jgi:heme oxygenase (biliverdin-producing, ferredoxin)